MVGLHQGSALRSFLFLLVINVINEDLLEVLYANDLLIITENEKDLQRKVVEWQEPLESGGLMVNVDQTEVMMSNREGKDREAIHEKRGSFVKQVKQFKYLGSTISQDGGCEAEDKNKIIAAWGKWRE
ncbi:uncharacterized protein [Palaemon carinicauda]|uniref:uncharacterized protein n=1 Tax=Palaemon carinicauda TaxID=392227 RepID=UPI0035B64753